MAKSCPICDQHMDLIVTGHRNHPFVDGKCYPRMCFGCYQVPLQFIYSYGRDGSIENMDGPFYDHRHLQTPEELYEAGSTDTLAEAQRCVAAVKAVVKQVSEKKLDKLKLSKPEADYELGEEPPKAVVQKKKRRQQTITAPVRRPKYRSWE